MNGLTSFSVKVAAVHRKHRRAIEVNRPYLRLSRSSLVVASAGVHLLENISTAKPQFAIV
jgi:hypothetical protein